MIVGYWRDLQGSAFRVVKSICILYIYTGFLYWDMGMDRVLGLGLRLVSIIFCQDPVMVCGITDFTMVEYRDIQGFGVLGLG